jgi:hypothetical protein
MKMVSFHIMSHLSVIIGLFPFSRDFLNKMLNIKNLKSDSSLNASISSALSKKRGTNTINLQQLTSSNGIYKAKSVDSNSSLLETVSLMDNGQMTFVSVNSTRKMPNNGSEENEEELIVNTRTESTSEESEKLDGNGFDENDEISEGETLKKSAISLISLPINSNESELVHIKRRATNKPTSQSKTNTNINSQSMSNDELLTDKLETEKSRAKTVKQYSKKFHGSFSNLDGSISSRVIKSSLLQRTDSIKKFEINKSHKFEKTDSLQKSDKLNKVQKSDIDGKLESREARKKAALKKLNSIEIKGKLIASSRVNSSSKEDKQQQITNIQLTQKRKHLKDKNVSRYEIEDLINNEEKAFNNNNNNSNGQSQGRAIKEMLIDKPPRDNSRLNREITDVNFLKNRYRSNKISKSVFDRKMTSYLKYQFILGL